MLSALLVPGVWSAARELFQVALQRFSAVARSGAVVVRLYLFGAVPRTAVAHRSCRHPAVCLYPVAGEGRWVNSLGERP